MEVGEGYARLVGFIIKMNGGIPNKAIRTRGISI